MFLPEIGDQQQSCLSLGWEAEALEKVHVVLAQHTHTHLFFPAPDFCVYLYCLDMAKMGVKESWGCLIITSCWSPLEYGPCTSGEP